MPASLHLFERVLSLSSEDMEFELSALGYLGWNEFLLNPRRLRGSDFLMRWSQGVWSEHRVIEAVEESGRFFALPYGPSGTAPDNDVRAFELYFERLDKAGLGKVKRPDLLIFRKSSQPTVERIVEEVGGVAELPFTRETDGRMRAILEEAIIAVECENSLWRAAQMPNYGTELGPQRRLDGKPGLKKSAVVPTVIIKEEDRQPLRKWQNSSGVRIHVWHVFYDLAFGLALDDAEQLIRRKLILPTTQTFQAPGGATTSKAIYKFYYHYAYPLGSATQEPELLPASITDKNGHILPYVTFKGGSLKLDPGVLSLLDRLGSERR
jgi:hypothetical protein